MTIYGNHLEVMERILSHLVEDIKQNSSHYEHLNYRIKSDESMREKCLRKQLPVNENSVLHEITDSIGIRVVTSFLDDVYYCKDMIKSLDYVEVVKEKDYIKNVKKNGYRSYHMILKIEGYFVEVQLRTIAMDSWAALEHKVSYKHQLKNKELIQEELKRCADELASCDLSMQTIKTLIGRVKSL